MEIRLIWGGNLWLSMKTSCGPSSGSEGERGGEGCDTRDKRMSGGGGGIEYWGYMYFKGLQNQ